MEQFRYIKTTAEEQNFILENKIEEKNSLIKYIKNIINFLSIGIPKVELIEEIDEEYYKREGGFEKETAEILDENRELYNEYFVINLMKQNRIINSNKNLEYTKKILTEFLLKYKNKVKHNNIYDNDEMVIQTNANVSTEDSFSSDSLILDTEEQMDIEFPSNDFSSKKDLGLNNDNNSNSNNNDNNNNKKEKNIIVPPLDLRLINFNSTHNGLSSREKSLSRKFFKSNEDKKPNERSLEENIGKIKEMIKNLKKKNKILENKCKKYEDNISKIALMLYSKHYNI